MTSTDATTTSEHADLLATLAAHRRFLRHTCRDLTDEQARRRTTVSELCLGGIVKHVTHVERIWAAFIRHGPPPGDIRSEERMAEFAEGFRMTDEDTLAGLLADYERAARATDDLVASLPDLGVSQPLPEAPWFAKGARWTARRVALHLIAETAQHAGHADILRESIDGAKTMG